MSAHPLQKRAGAQKPSTPRGAADRRRQHSLATCLQRGFRWLPATAEAAAEDAFACPSWRAPSKKCHASPLWTFEPSADGCAWWHSITRLSRSAFARALAGRTLRFIGDSLALDQYRHLARCVLNCSSQEVQPRNINQGNLQWTEQMDAELRAAGFDSHVAHNAHRFLGSTSAKEAEAEGCALEHGGRVQFRRINQLPDAVSNKSALVAALMHILLLSPSTTALTRRDLVVMNVGLHRSDSLPVAHAAMVRWWAEQRRTRPDGAPRLLWRQVSPQHWPTAPVGMFRSLDDVMATRNQTCRAAEPSTDEALQLYDMNVSAALQALRASEGEDRSWADVLPTFHATWARSDDHPRLTSGALSGSFTRSASRMAGLSDCTHFCATGSVLRFWSQALLAWIRTTPA